MLAEEKVGQYLQQFQLTLAELMLILDTAVVRELAADEVYIQQGNTSRKLAYIQKGLVRAYHLKESGEEITVLLRWEDQFFNSYDSVFLGQPSRFTYKTMEDTVILESDYDTFMELINSSPKFSKAKDFFMTKMMAELLQRIESFVLLSPQERYLKLLSDKPDIVQRCPDKHIATLLGITPVSLSRIRKRLAGKSAH
ncbi:MAG: Crp/Fnr family transcriptional regulator [Bacteroidota bacterium]